MSFEEEINGILGDYNTPRSMDELINSLNDIEVESDPIILGEINNIVGAAEPVVGDAVPQAGGIYTDKATVGMVQKAIVARSSAAPEFKALADRLSAHSDEYGDFGNLTKAAIKAVKKISGVSNPDDTIDSMVLVALDLHPVPGVSPVMPKSRVSTPTGDQYTDKPVTQVDDKAPVEKQVKSDSTKNTAPAPAPAPALAPQSMTVPVKPMTFMDIANKQISVLPLWKWAVLGVGVGAIATGLVIALRRKSPSHVDYAPMTVPSMPLAYEG